MSTPGDTSVDARLYYMRLQEKSWDSDATWTAQEKEDFARWQSARDATEATRGDGFAPWRAITLCRWAGLPVPDWVLDYLGRVARALVALDCVPVPAPDAFASGVQDALELQRPRREQGRDAMLASDARLRVTMGAKLSVAWDETAKEFGVSWPTVRRAYFDRYPEEEGTFRNR